MADDVEKEEVSVTEMDDATLDAQLNKEEIKEEVQEETPATETAEEVTETTTTETETTETTEQEETDEQKKDRIIKQQEEFIQRRNSELGEARKQLEFMAQELAKFNPEEVNEQYYTDPSAAVNAVLEQRARRAQAEQLAQHIAVQQNEIVVKAKIPEIDSMIDDISNFALADGAAPEVIKLFKANPYAAPPDLLIQLAARVKVEKENKELKAQIEELKKKPEEALKKVEQAARQSVTGATGKTGTGAVSAKQIHQMSDAELDAFLSSSD